MIKLSGRFVVAYLLLGISARAHAFQNGITGLTNDSVTGCNQCHSGGLTPTVTLSGPTTVLPGSINEYLLEIFEIGGQNHGGLDIGATDGNLGSGGSNSSFTQAVGGEITHTSPKPGDGTAVKFSFLWTAPNVVTTSTLHGWGNAVNFSGTNAGDAASYATLDVDTADTHDAVVLPASAFNITIKHALLGVTKKFKVKVRNADPAGASPQTIALAQTNDCPGMGLTISQPDFDTTTSLIDTQAVVDAGKTKTATITVNITPDAFTTYNHLAPNRCTLTFASSFPLLTNIDPTPSNDSTTVELNVIDKNDLPEQSTPHETSLTSVSSLLINIPKTKPNKTSKAKAVVRNADFLPSPETPGHPITLAIDLSACPWLSATPIDFLPKTPTIDNPVIVKGGKTAAAAIAITADASQVTTPNRLAPLRCIADVTASGPVTPDQSPGNNTSKVVIDVVDKNDL